jgi:hypothetical protein
MQPSVCIPQHSSLGAERKKERAETARNQMESRAGAQKREREKFKKADEKGEREKSTPCICYLTITPKTNEKRTENS